MMIGLVQPGTSRGTFLQMMGSRNTTPPRMLRMVPFGDFHISLRPNSFTRASSGVMVAHLTPTPTFLMALAASTVTWSLVLSRYSIPRSKYIRLISRIGLISLSLMYCQMIRVISSPSSSTTGLVTLIFAMKMGPFWNSAFRDEWGDCIRAIALQTRWRKPRRYALSADLLAQSLGSDCSEPRLCLFIFDAFSSREPATTPHQVRGRLSLENALERRLRGRARHHVPGDDDSADQRACQAGACAPPCEA